MIKLKDDSVWADGLDRRLWVAYGVALAVYEELGNQHNCVITSANDGQHMYSSKHYSDEAIDLRVWGFDDHARRVATVMIGSRLSLDYDVIDEGNHIHIEWDPK